MISIIKNAGQSVLPIVLVTSLFTTAGNWFMNRILEAPDKGAVAIANAQGDIGRLQSVLSTLCNDYGQTVSRLDQNMQNIAKALKTTVVVGNANADPCKTK